MRPSVYFIVLLVAGALQLVGGAADAQGQIPVEPGNGRDEVTFSTDNGPQYIVVRDFKVTEVQPTGKEDEYALTLLALTLRGEPDQRVMGGILFEIDGKSTLVPFEQGGVGDVIVRAQPDADFITLRAVDSNATHQAELPKTRRWMWWGLIIIPIIAFRALRMRRAKEAAKAAEIRAAEARAGQ